MLSQAPHVAEVIASIVAWARLVAPDAATFVALAVDIVQAEGGQHERARCPDKQTQQTRQHTPEREDSGVNKCPDKNTQGGI